MLSFHIVALIILVVLIFLPCQFVSELARVAAPGGTIIIVTWCHRNLAPSKKSLKPNKEMGLPFGNIGLRG